MDFDSAMVATVRKLDHDRRKLRMIYPDESGNCIESISPKSYWRTWEYDALDQVISEEEQDIENGIH